MKIEEFTELPENILKAWGKLTKDNPDLSIVLVVGSSVGIEIKSNMCPQATFNFLTIANEIGYEELAEPSDFSRN